VRSLRGSWGGLWERSIQVITRGVGFGRRPFSYRRVAAVSQKLA
jgi:hypothetical protein